MMMSAAGHCAIQGADKHRSLTDNVEDVPTRLAGRFFGKAESALRSPGMGIPAHQICFIFAVFLAIISASGCTSARGFMAGRQQDPMAGAPCLRNSSNPRLEEVVDHLNKNTDRIQSWRANNVVIRADKWSLSGKLAVEKGRHVRLVVTSPMGNEVDLGSNDERFWIWSRRMDPAFVTCKHENMEVARQRLGVPFEPDWLMQALGVAPLPTSNVKMEADPANEQARLVEQVVSAHGKPLRRVVLVDLKKGIVLEHSLYDYDSNRVALAKLSAHRMDKVTGVVLPHRVHLDWPQSRMSMTMDLGKVQINPESIPSVIWDMPAMPGCEVVHLDAGADSNRIAVRPDTVVRTGSVQPEPFQRKRRHFEDDPEATSTDNTAGHVRLTGDIDDVRNSDLPGDDLDDWAK